MTVILLKEKRRQVQPYTMIIPGSDSQTRTINNNCSNSGLSVMAILVASVRAKHA